MPDRFWSGHLDARHRLEGFDCGVPALDDWLVHMAFRADRQDIARVYVWTCPEDITVLGYCSVSPTRVAGDGVASGGLTGDSVPRSAGGGHSQVPGYLIGRSAHRGRSD
jgi:hypothetical protein